MTNYKGTETQMEYSSWWDTMPKSEGLLAFATAFIAKLEVYRVGAYGANTPYFANSTELLHSRRAGDGVAIARWWNPGQLRRADFVAVSAPADSPQSYRTVDGHKSGDFCSAERLAAQKRDRVRLVLGTAGCRSPSALTKEMYERRPRLLAFWHV